MFFFKIQLENFRFNNETGEWKHHTNLGYRERKWLGNVSDSAEGGFTFSDRHAVKGWDDGEDGNRCQKVTDEAKGVYAEAKKAANRLQVHFLF